ncbi:WhiB family transcriptional regulator [Nonomuraea recticatena]|uniref:WhiB family transcriptional regulator n=1 Tax=Nonomuraea recticatena TaxID=46178 RepID=UPI003617B05D
MPLGNVREISWLRRGACRTSDPDLFFPPAPSPVQEARAKAVCSGCQVLDDCRAYAVRSGETEGIWGGLTPRNADGCAFPPDGGSAAHSLKGCCFAPSPCSSRPTSSTTVSPPDSRR